MLVDQNQALRTKCVAPRQYAVVAVILLGAFMTAIAVGGQPAAKETATAPSFPNLTPKLAQIQNQITRLNAAGEKTVAGHIEAKLKSLESQMSGAYSPTTSDEIEVHGVSLEEGAPAPPGLLSGRERFTTGYAEVRITHTARPILLVLQGNRAIHWNVRAEKSVKFAAVFLCGGERQTVAGLPRRTLVVDQSSGRAGGEGMPTLSDSAASRAVLEAWAQDQLGFSIATVQAASRYTGEPIVLGPENAIWRDQQLTRHAESLLAEAQATTRERQQDRVAKLRFTSVYYVPFSRVRAGHEGPTAGGVGEFTVAGAIQSTLRPIEKNMRFPVAVDTGKEKLTFAISQHGELVIVDDAWEDNGPKIPQDAKLNESGRVSNLTLDSKRKRLVCATRDGRAPKLLAYDLTTNQWSALAAPGRQVKGLTYVAEQDQFYALAPNTDETGRGVAGSTLYVYDGMGKEVRKRALELTLLGSAFSPYGVSSVHLAMVDGLLVIHSPPAMADPQGLAGRIDVLDPSSGDVVYTGPPAVHDGKQAVAKTAKPLPQPRGRLGKSLRLVSRIEAAIVNLRREGEVAVAEACAKEIGALRGQLVGDAEPAATDPELYVVGSYRSNGTVVEVTQTSRPVVLVCSAYDPSEWTIKAAPVVNLKRIVVGGYHRQEVKSAPAGVPLENYSHDEKTGGFYLVNLAGRDGNDFGGLERFKELVSLPISTFQSAPRQPGQTLTVGPTDADWRFQRVVPKLEALLAKADRKDRAARQEALAGIKFRAIQRTKNPRGETVAAAMADFTVQGPIIHSLVPLPKSYPHLAYDAQDERLFAISSHSVGEVDPNTGAAAEMPIAGRLPPLSWPCGLAFDSKRRRVVLTSLGGEGFLYAYDLARKEWSLLTSMKNKDMTALTYDQENDVLYGLFEDRLQTMTPEGAVLRWPRIDMSELGGRGKSFDPFGPTVQLVAAGGYVAAIRSEIADESGRVTRPGLIRLYDPRTGDTVYEGTTRPHAGFEKLSPQQIEQFWEGMADENAKAADKAAWQLAAGRDDAVRFVAAELDKIRPKVDAEAVKRLVKELDAEKFAEREAAQRKLAEMGPAIEDELQKYAENPSAEVRQRVGALLKRLQESEPTEPALRRTLLAVEVLQRAGTDQAKAALKKLAAGSSTRQLARAAAAALKRLEAGE